MREVFSGDIYMVDLNPVKGREQGEYRPVVVLQNPNLSRFTTTALCVPITSNLGREGLEGTCLIKKGEGGLPKESIALAFQLRALDTSRFRRKLGRLSPAALDDVADAVLNALGIVVE